MGYSLRGDRIVVFVREKLSEREKELIKEQVGVRIVEERIMKGNVVPLKGGDKLRLG